MTEPEKDIEDLHQKDIEDLHQWTEIHILGIRQIVHEYRQAKAEAAEGEGWAGKVDYLLESLARRAEELVDTFEELNKREAAGEVIPPGGRSGTNAEMNPYTFQLDLSTQWRMERDLEETGMSDADYLRSAIHREHNRRWFAKKTGGDSSAGGEAKSA